MAGQGQHFKCPACGENKSKKGCKFARIDNLIRKICAECRVDNIVTFHHGNGVLADTQIDSLTSKMIDKKVSIRRLAKVAGVSEGTIFKAKHGKLINAFLAQCVSDAIDKMEKNDKYYRAGFAPTQKGRHAEVVNG